MFLELIQRLSAQVPSQCAVCHTWPSRPVCEACVSSFAQPVPRCKTCAIAVPEGIQHCGECVLHPPVLDQCLAAVDYAYPWSRLITEFKFREHTAWASTFATLMRSAPWVEPALEAADVIVPMPLFDLRLQSRGYNQSLELARALAPHKTVHSLLLRITDTPPQSSLSRKDRLRNVQDAFAVDPLKAATLHGKRAVLVDDVMTSGASLHSAANALRSAGAAHITALVFARTA